MSKSNMVAVSNQLRSFGVKHTLVLAKADAEIRRESDGKLFGSYEQGSDTTAEFTERLIAEAKKIESILGDACLIHIGGISFQLGRDGKLKPSAKHTGKIDDAKMLLSI